MRVLHAAHGLPGFWLVLDGLRLIRLKVVCARLRKGGSGRRERCWRRTAGVRTVSRWSLVGPVGPKGTVNSVQPGKGLVGHLPGHRCQPNRFWVEKTMPPMPCPSPASWFCAPLGLTSFFLWFCRSRSHRSSCRLCCCASVPCRWSPSPSAQRSHGRRQ